MPLFMMISGYVYGTAYFDDHGEPDRKRINRQVYNLIGVYVIFSAAYYFCKMLFRTVVNSEVTLIDVALMGVRQTEQTWYVYTLILLYLIFSVKRLAAMNQWVLLYVLAAAAVCGQRTNIEWFMISNVLYYALFFFIGISYRRNKQWIIGNGPLTLILFCASAALCVMFWDRAINRILIVSIIIALGFSLALWYVFEHIPFLGNCTLFKIVGKHALEIYLIHYVLIPGVELFFLAVGINHLYGNIFLNLVISAAAPVLISEICYKMGIHDLFFKPFTYLCAWRGGGDKGQQGP